MHNEIAVNYSLSGALTVITVLFGLNAVRVWKRGVKVAKQAVEGAAQRLARRRVLSATRTVAILPVVTFGLLAFYLSGVAFVDVKGLFLNILTGAVLLLSTVLLVSATICLFLLQFFERPRWLVPPGVRK